MVAENLEELHKYCKDEIKKAYDTQASFTDRRHTKTPNWNVGDMVWLNTKNIKTKCPLKKLDHTWIGPLKVLVKIGTHAYQLELPA